MVKRVWIVEVKFSNRYDWEPTVGVALNRKEGRERLKEWREHVAYNDKLRLRAYYSHA